MKNLFALAKPFLHKLDPEDAHRLTIEGMKRMPVLPAPKVDRMLQQNLLGLDFVHPLGLAAGFDKGCEISAPMHSIGFSFVEAGTVTPRPQEGNPRPRVFRDAGSKAVINRMGFPNPGAEVFFANLKRAKAKYPSHIIGANIGKNKDTEIAIDDYKCLAQKCDGIADYVTINISSPNTPGLRDLQNGEFVQACVKAVKAEYYGSVLVKLAPDLTDEQLADMAQASLISGVDGVILTNTTLVRPEYLPSDFAAQTGGLSGEPLTQKALDIVRQFRRETRGKVTIVAAGGISNAQDAYDRIKAGASLLQLYTALVFQGPAVVRDIVQSLPVLLRRDGFVNIKEAIGSEISNGQ